MDHQTITITEQRYTGLVILSFLSLVAGIHFTILSVITITLYIQTDVLIYYMAFAASFASSITFIFMSLSRGSRGLSYQIAELRLRDKPTWTLDDIGDYDELPIKVDPKTGMKYE